MRSILCRAARRGAAGAALAILAACQSLQPAPPPLPAGTAGVGASGTVALPPPPEISPPGPVGAAPPPVAPADSRPPAAPGAPAPPGETAPPVPSPAPPPPPRPIHIALALGGGGTRGFAHVGVIKALEARGIEPDIVVGTSVGSFVAALYAAGYAGADLQKVAMQFEESSITDWSLPSRGLFKGLGLQDFVNRKVDQRPIEKLPRKLAIVATELDTGDMVVFERGNVGMAVRASSSVPGVFQPVSIGGHEFVDGGLVSPVPVRVARRLGADVVIAVDISKRPADQSTTGAFDILLQTFAIMGQVIARSELQSADIVLRPALGVAGSTDFSARETAIREGEQAVAAQAGAIAAAVARARQNVAEIGTSAPAH
jgi:NTE family protein